MSLHHQNWSCVQKQLHQVQKNLKFLSPKNFPFPSCVFFVAFIIAPVQFHLPQSAWCARQQFAWKYIEDANFFLFFLFSHFFPRNRGKNLKFKFFFWCYTKKRIGNGEKWRRHDHDNQAIKMQIFYFLVSLVLEMKRKCEKWLLIEMETFFCVFLMPIWKMWRKVVLCLRFLTHFFKKYQNRARYATFDSLFQKIPKTVHRLRLLTKFN